MAAGISTGAPIYEATYHLGGICRTYTKEGFEFDSGGPHWIFGENKGFEFIKSLVYLKTYQRDAGIYYNKIFPYPIQTFAEQSNSGTPGYFKDWNNSRFSKELCNMFFHPFNEKYMAGLYDEVIQFDAYKTPKTGSKGYAPSFHNPEGGLNVLVNKMAEMCHITLNKRAVAVLPEQKQVIFEDGKNVGYDRLISTIPLNSLLHICGKKDFSLPYSSVFVLNIGATPGINFPKEHWLYIPFCKSGFHRVGFYTNVEPEKAPKGMVSLSIEIAFAGVDYWELDVPYIIRNFVEELQSWRWIEDVIVTDPTWVKVAYTWNKSETERIEHLEWLRQKDIISIGRYGKWKFCGLTESIQDGLNVS